MKALVKQSYEPYDAALQHIADPVPEPGEVVIKVHAAGICGTDMKIYHGQYTPYKTPVVMGHELTGRIVAVGKDVTHLALNTPVTSRTIVTHCRKCPLCITGRENLCRAKTRLGFDHDGAFAQYVKVRQEQVHALPDSLNLTVAVLAEVLCVVAHALKPVKIKPSHTVLVIGPGPVGLAASILAKAEGATVVVTGLPDDTGRLALAQEVGADFTEVGNGENAELKNLMKITRGLGPDVVLECSGTAGGINQGLQLCRSGGRYVQIGTRSSQVTVDFMKIAYKELEVSGSIGHTRLDWEDTIPLIARYQERLYPLVKYMYPLDNWQEAFAAAEGKDAAKVVLLPNQ